MGVLTTSGKNVALNALASAMTHVAAFDHSASRNVTGVTSTDIITDTATPLSDGNIIVFTAKTGGSGVSLLTPYYVISKTANTFQISLTSGGSAVDLGSDLTATTSYVQLVEISGGSPAYARKAIAYNSASGGSIDDSTNGAVFDIPAGATVDSIGFYTASTAGTLHAWDDVTSESFAAQGTYTVTDADHDLNA